MAPVVVARVVVAGVIMARVVVARVVMAGVVMAGVVVAGVILAGVIVTHVRIMGVIILPQVQINFTENISFFAGLRDAARNAHTRHALNSSVGPNMIWLSQLL
jgi:hypothetical protein